MHKWILTLTGTLSVSFILSSIALADAIDGDWCDSNGKRMSIRGPTMVTPGGQQISGNYSRHYFSYVIPAGETERARRWKSNCLANISPTRVRATTRQCMNGGAVSQG